MWVRYLPSYLSPQIGQASGSGLSMLILLDLLVLSFFSGSCIWADDSAGAEGSAVSIGTGLGEVGLGRRYSSSLTGGFEMDLDRL